MSIVITDSGDVGESLFGLVEVASMNADYILRTLLLIRKTCNLAVDYIVGKELRRRQ